MKKGQQSIIVSFFIAIMIAVILVVVASDFVTDQNTLKTSLNETVVTINATAVALANDDLVQGTFNMENQTGGTVRTVPATSYILDILKGTVTVNDSNYNFTNQVNYTYFPPGFVKGGTNRTLILLIPIFIILALILFITAKITQKE